MDKLRMQSSNGVEDNITKIAQLFPDCVTETVDERSGQPKHLIDFEKLKQNLSDSVMSERAERYQFTWPDKSKAILLANSPINATLRPCREDSVDFDNTQNLYIEGDNLDVLKCLKETYLHKVKMIYIDPPYNTGNDFVYEDDFAQSSEEYLANSGQFDEQGNRMFTNAESNGRFHTDWLNMIYPRLKVARDLLTDDGVIFISIDDNEVENLKKICDEIFGYSSFIDIFNWAKTETPENLSKKSKQIIEYVLCYQKHKNSLKFKGIKKESVSSNGLLNQPNKIGILTFPANVVKTSIKDGLIKAGKYGTDAYDVDLLEETEVKKGLFIKPVILKARFKWSQDYLNKEIERGTEIRIPTLKFSPSYEKKEYDAEVPANLINSKVGVGTNEGAGGYQEVLFGKKVFNFPKPTSLIEYLIGFNENEEKNILIMDFFSGSATTADAVMRLNAKRGENKFQYILVQIEEDLHIAYSNAKTESAKQIAVNAIKFCEEYNLPYNICSVAKERIRRAGKKIKEESPLTTQDLDTGFRVLKLDSTNMQDIYYSPKDISQADLFSQVDNVKPDRTGEDLLFQVMLELGATLDSKIETTTVAGKTIYNVAEGYLVACFDPDVTDDVVKAIAQMQPAYAVLRDNSMKDDSTATNFEQIFKTYSPDTVTKIL